MTWWLVAFAVLGFVIASILVRGRHGTPHLFESWEGFDLAIRGLMLEMKPGATLQIRHRASGRTVVFEKLHGSSERSPILRFCVPHSVENRNFEQAVRRVLSGYPEVEEVRGSERLIDTFVHGRGEAVVSVGVQAAHSAFRAMDASPEDHFDRQYQGDDDAEYFRVASQQYVDHPSRLIRWPAKLSNRAARERLRLEKRVAERRRRRGLR